MLKRANVIQISVFVVLFLTIRAVQFCSKSSGSGPSALEGFGAQAIGGSNSKKIYHVTNTDSSGPGSLVDGLGSDRTIVFDVSGTIVTRLDIANISYLTIDGSGQDITIDNDNNGNGISVLVGSHHIIIKNIRVINAGEDGINVVDGAHDVMITQCSAYDNNDGNIDVAADDSNETKNVTVQYSILGKGRSSSSSYSGDMLITAQNVSIHHNLFVPATPDGVGERAPLVHCNYSPVGSPNADIRNNLVWKFGRDNATGSGFGADIAYGATANVVNNYYYSPSDGGNAVVVDGSYGSTPFGSAFVSGNISGNDGVHPNDQNNHDEYSIPGEASVTTQEACEAARQVLSHVGPERRNSIEQALIDDIDLPDCPD